MFKKVNIVVNDMDYENQVMLWKQEVLELVIICDYLETIITKQFKLKCPQREESVVPRSLYPSEYSLVVIWSSLYNENGIL